MGKNTLFRMEQLLGAPPRIEPLAEEELDEHAWEAIRGMRVMHNFPLGDPVHPFYRTLSRSSAMFGSFLGLGKGIAFDSTIPPRFRELVILRSCWLCGAPYPWGEHVPKAKRTGLTSEDIERITQGSEVAGWDDADRAVLKAVEELHEDAMICDNTWAALANYFDDRQLVELPIIVGHYHMTAFIQNSLRFRLNPDNQGLEAR